MIIMVNHHLIVMVIIQVAITRIFNSRPMEEVMDIMLIIMEMGIIMVITIHECKDLVILHSKMIDYKRHQWLTN